MKRTLALLFACNVVLAGAARADQVCSSPTDQGAFDVAALKSELSILAIACGQQDDYNRFVEKYRPELVAEDRVVNNWFTKTYGRNARAHYDAFITLLANEQSNVGQHQGSDFCPRLKVVFAEAMAVPEMTLLPEYAAAKDLVPAAMGTCATETAAPAKPDTRHPARRPHS